MGLGSNGQGLGQATDVSANVEDEVRKTYEELAAKAKETDSETPDDVEPESTSDSTPEVPAEESPAPSEDAAGNSTEEAQQADAPAVEEKPKRGRPKDDEIPPPTSWKADAKEWFRKLPKHAKQEYSRQWVEFERYKNQELTQISNQRKDVETRDKEVESIRTQVQRFLPIWGVQGVTPETAITELLAFNHKIVSKDISALHQVAKALGVEIEVKGQGNAQQAKNYEPPTLPDVERLVENKINSVYQQQNQSQQFETVKQQIDSAFRELRDEVNEDGKYVRPDLHDSEFLKRIEPLVLARARANPGKPWREHFEKVYRAEDGRIIPKSQATTTKLNQQRNGTAARRASSFNSGSYGNQESDLSPHPGETTLQTTQRIAKALGLAS